MTTARPSPMPHRPSSRPRRSARAALVGAAVSVALVSACSSGGYKSTSGTTAAPAAAGGKAGSAGSAGSAVTIDNFAFSPASLAVKTGTKVTVTNKDSTTHTWTADTGQAASWDSSDLSSGASFSFTFTKAGTFTYHCKIHSSMTGTIVVS